MQARSPGIGADNSNWMPGAAFVWSCCCLEYGEHSFSESPVIRPRSTYPGEPRGVMRFFAHPSRCKRGPSGNAANLAAREVHYQTRHPRAEHGLIFDCGFEILIRVLSLRALVYGGREYRSGTRKQETK